MSKSTKHIPPVNKPENAGKSPTTAGPKPFRVPYPLLFLAAAVIIVYGATIHFGLTDLDDTIFIRDFHAYNENVANLFTSFHRGLFDALKDPYYRPLFMDSMMFNYWFSDHGADITIYHIVNLLLHIGCVFLLYTLFRRLAIKELHAFLLCLVFAVHPVLVQAVAWIPGRNDTLLAIFVFSFLINVVDYVNKGKLRSLLLSALFLLLAYFTKETAVFAAPVAFVLLILFLHKKWNDKNNLIQYATWVGCFLIWYAVRASATVQTDITPVQVAHDFLSRLPLIVQYIGKVILPFNLSVFPTQQDTVYYYGIAAIILLGAAIFMAKEKNTNAVLGGIAIFLLFLLPVLFVPAKLNEQSFEHRLYLPMVGILLLLPSTVLLSNKLSDKSLFTGWMIVTGAFAIMSFARESHFEDPVSFWSNAMQTSPHSAYATMMLAARLDKSETDSSAKLFRRAYALNSKEKYVNFYMGEMLQKKDSVPASEKYLLAEKSISDYYECDFYLARVAMEKKDLPASIQYLQGYLKRDPENKMANNNLLLLYINTQQPDKARAQAKQMLSAGIEVPAQVRQQLGL